MHASTSRHIYSLLGLLLIVAGAVVPSSAWITLLRPDLQPGELRDVLVTGAHVFRVALVLLGLATIGFSRVQSAGTENQQGIAAPAPLSRHEFFALVGLLVSALALRLIALNAGLWHDEIATLVNYGHLSPGEIVTTYDSQNQHFLYTIFARPLLTLFGADAAALRLPAVLFGVAGIGALFLFVREVGTPAEAWLSSALMTLSYHHIWFSQNARGYTALLFFTLLSSWFFVRGVDRGRDADWLAFGLTTALGVYTHLTMVFVVLGQFLIYLFVRMTHRGVRRRPSWLEFGLSFGLAGLLSLLLYSFVVPQIVLEFTADSGGVDFETWQNPLWMLVETFRSVQIGFAGGSVVLAGLVVFAVGGISWLRDRPIVAFLFALPVIICAAVTIATGHNFWPRLFFFAMGFGILIAIRGVLESAALFGRLVRLPDAWVPRAAILAVLLVIAMSASTVPRAYGPKQDYEGARAYVLATMDEQDVVGTAGMAAFALREYLHEDWMTVESPETLAELAPDGRRAWFVYSFPPYMEAMYPEMFARIEGEFEVVEEFHGTLGGGTVYVSLSNPTHTPIGAARANIRTAAD